MFHSRSENSYGRERVPQSAQRQNLETVQEKKKRKLEKLLQSARKQGQIRSLERMNYLLEQEIEKELKELSIIETDLENMAAWSPRIR